METLAVERVAPSGPVRAMLARAARHTTGDTLDEVIAAGVCLAVMLGERLVGAIVLEWQGNTVWVLAWAADSAAVQRDMTAALDAWLTRYAHEAGFRSAAFLTRRRGLEKKCRALGWRVAERNPQHVMMRKDYR